MKRWISRALAALLRRLIPVLLVAAVLAFAGFRPSPAEAETRAVSSSHLSRWYGLWRGPVNGEVARPEYVLLDEEFATISATLVDVTGMAFTVEADEIYYIEGVLLIKTSATSEGFDLTFTTPLFDAFGVHVYGSASATGPVGRHIIASAGLAAFASYVGPDVYYPVFVTGMIAPSEDGVLQLQIDAETGDPQIATVGVGSYLKIERLVQ